MRISIGGGNREGKMREASGSIRDAYGMKG